MQRSVAKASTAQPSTPTGPPSKRMRHSTGPSTPGTPSDQELMQAALLAEQKKHQAAVDKEAAAVGETRWVLSFKDPDEIDKKPKSMKVVTAGFAALDADEDDSEEETKPVGRMTFGNFTVQKVDMHILGWATNSEQKKTEAVPAKGGESSSESESESGSSEDDYDDDDPTSQLIREEARKAKLKAKQAANNRTPKRKNQEIDLDKITSISGRTSTPNQSSNRACYSCGRTGHLNANCPENQNRGGRGGKGGAGGYGGGRGREKYR